MKPKSRRRRGQSSGWLSASLGIHGLFFLILALTPVGDKLLDRVNPEEDIPAVRADRIEEIIDHIRDREEERIEDQVEELLYVEEVMGDILDEQLEQYDLLEDELAIGAPEQALLELEKARTAQKKAHEIAQRAEQVQNQRVAPAYQALREQNEPSREEEAAARKVGEEAHRETDQTQNQVKDRQAEASGAQKTARRQLDFTGDFYDAARQSQRQANAAQERANQAQDTAAQLQQQAHQRNNGDAPNLQRNALGAASSLEHARDWHDNEIANVERHRTNIADVKARLAERQGKLGEEQTKAKTAEQNAAEAKKAAEQTNDAKLKREAQRVAQRAADQARNAQRAVENAQRQVEHGVQDLQRAEQQLPQIESRLTEARSNLEPAEMRALDQSQQAEQAVKQAAELSTKAAATQKQVIQDQAAAIEAQSKAIETLKKAIADSREGSNDRPQTAAADAKPARPSIQYAQLRNMSITQLYDQAVQTETRIADKHKEIKSARTAITAQMPLSEATAQTRVAKPQRPELDDELLSRPIRTAKAATEHKAEVNRATQEMTSMVVAAHQRLSQSLSATEMAGAEEGMEVSLADILAQGEQAAAMQAAALEDAGAQYKDLSGLMRQGQNAGQSKSGKSGAPGAAAIGKGAGQDLPAWRRWPIGSVTRTSDPRMRRLGATRIASHGTRGIPTDSWVYIDTWYSIGPFANPRRRNIDTIFPPQSVIDLDATYTGKDGEKIRWEFIKEPFVMLRPPHDGEYTISYCYTELWFDQALDALIAVGSDDNSRVWINGQLVWMSGKELKGWKVDEGYRTVHFKKGRNRILYRIENGWHSMEFSMMICLKSARSAPPKGDRS